MHVCWSIEWLHKMLLERPTDRTGGGLLPIEKRVGCQCEGLKKEVVCHAREKGDGKGAR